MFSAMTVLQSILLILTSCMVGAAFECDLPIRRHHVLNAWHSSHGFGQRCFYNRSRQDEADSLSGRASYRYIHSLNKNHSVDGYHWFAVQLHESVLITSVTVKGREDGVTETYPRAADIEMWTSSSGRTIFSGHHCRSKDIGKQFRKSIDHWNFCGITNNNSRIVSGQNFTVPCTAEVRHLLLRRNVSHIQSRTELDSDYMSFADLRLHVMQLKFSAPTEVEIGSKFAVSCSLHCNITGRLQFCLPNGSCKIWNKTATVEIASAQPEHSGTYRCRLNSTERSATVSVLSSSNSTRVKVNDSLAIKCLLYCNGTNSTCDRPELNRQLRLCFPNSETCSNQTSVIIQAARPSDTGVYKCKFNATERRIEARVLYPPADASILMMNNLACKRPSDMRVMFTSAAADPPAEHWCRTHGETGRRAGNLTRTSQEITVANSAGISWWSFGVDEAHAMEGWISGTIECIAVQTLPDGVRFQNKRATAAWSCSSERSFDHQFSWSFMYAIGGISVALAIFILLSLVVVKMLASRRVAGRFGGQATNAGKYSQKNDHVEEPKPEDEYGILLAVSGEQQPPLPPPPPEVRRSECDGSDGDAMVAE